MEKSAKVFIGGVVIFTVATVLLTRRKPENKSNFYGRRGAVLLRPTAPVSPNATITAVQFLNADGTPVAPVSAPVSPTPTPAPSPSPLPTPPTSPPPPNGDKPHHHHPPKNINIYSYGYPYFYPYYYYGLYYPYGQQKSVYCMTEYGTLTVVDGCRPYETADECCRRKSRRGKLTK